MSTLVVGGTGLLGSAVCDRLDDAEAASRRTGFDFFDEGSADALRDRDPDSVVLAATVERSAVPRKRYDAAVRRFLDASTGRRLVYISSDAVFDGRTGRYAPDVDRSPVDRYGRRLVAFEDAIDGSDLADAVVLRPSYLYAGDPLDPRLSAAVEALRAGETYERFEDMYRSPAHVDEVAAAVVALLDGDATGTLHVPGPRLSVHEFHREALRTLGVETAGLTATRAPDDGEFAVDRSLVDERFASVTGVDLGRPGETLSTR